MEFLQRATNPWGQEILVRVSWDLIWWVVIASALFLLGHQILRRRWIAKEAAAVAAVADDATLPEKIAKHSLPSRLFHWSMSASMLVLLFTGFLPVVGIEFSWLAIHWIAGLVLIGTVVFHVLHVLVRRSLLKIWVGPRDLKDLAQDMSGALSGSGSEAKAGKYPVENKLFHHAAVVTSLGVAVTGILMMVRIEQPFVERNPYLYSEGTWGIVFVIHGLAALCLIGLVVAHIYFAVLPEKRWMLRSMIYGWIGRRDYLAHHDPERWRVGDDR